MNTARIRIALALVSLGAVFAAGCAAAPPSERKGGTTSHLEGDEGDGSGAEAASAEEAPAAQEVAANNSAGESEEAPAEETEVAANDQQAAIPALVVIGVVALGVAAICTTHNILCANAAKDRCGGEASVVSACSGSLKSLVEVKCEISCPSKAG